ncbi:MAG TPA: histidine kinase [Flavisolibacter sp.]|nr:histidine kinase [Flavisolibacter sp.]
MVKENKRYSFWKIFWVVLGINIFFGLLGLIAMSMINAPGEHYQDELLSLKNLEKQCINIFFTTLFAYFALNYYYQLIRQKKSFIDYLRYSVVFTIACFAYYFALSYVFPPKVSASEHMTTSILIFSHSLTTLFFLGITILIAYLTSLRDEKKHNLILEEQKMQLEVEKSQANFNFLKAQINPHFLHNTLNFLYARSLRYSPELSEGILTLSEIMRYALSEGNTKDGKVLLQQEIEHVNNVIKINQLRFNNNLKVCMQVHGVVNHTTIIPFVLITIVENAFKHGDLQNAEFPIEIKLNVSNNHLLFHCRNKKKKGPKDKTTGLGLDNIKKRLDLAYGQNYSLDIKDENEFYTTELTINEL